jgi:N-methylhydantoinase A
MKLDERASSDAIRKDVAEPLGIGVEEAAAAIVRFVNNNMANALRVSSIDKGYDARDFALMAFGGSGPLHAAALVDTLGIRRILVPRGYASVLCALGDVLADIRESRRRGYYARSESIDLADLAAAVNAMIDEADAALGEHTSALERVVRCGLEMRYKGQTHEVTVPIGERLEPSPERWAQILDNFDRVHHQRFSFSRPGAEVEVIGLEVDRFAMRPKPQLNGLGHGSAAAAPARERRVHFPSEGGFRATPVYAGAELDVGFTATGPLIVEEANTSVVVLPGQRIGVAEGNVYTIEAA